MALAMKQGTMLANFSQMGLVKMKTPAETRSKVIDIDRMAKLTEEVAGEPVGEGHWKSVLVGMLDPVTRQHTSRMMGSQHSVHDLKQAILEFTSNVVIDQSDAMQIGQVGEAAQGGLAGGAGGAEGEQGGWEAQGWDAEGAYALRKGGPKGGCFQCGGAHYAANCPKGKGKGNQKGKGKGGGGGKVGKGGGKAGPKGGCFNCGGAH